jgi:hypothetical protein
LFSDSRSPNSVGPITLIAADRRCRRWPISWGRTWRRADAQSPTQLLANSSPGIRQQIIRSITAGFMEAIA